MFSEFEHIKVAQKKSDKTFRLFGNNIATPSQKFVNKFLELTGIYLMASNHKFYHHTYSAVAQKYTLNINAVDKFLAENDNEYDCDKYTFKGKTCSMKSYVMIKFGSEVYDMFTYLLKSDFTNEFTGIDNN